MRNAGIRVATVSIALLGACTLTSHAADAAYECLGNRAWLEVGKVQLNASLQLPFGSRLPDDAVTKWETAAVCPAGGKVSANVSGTLPSCSKHGEMKERAYIDYLQVATMADDKETVALAAYALAKRHGNPKSKIYDQNKAMQYVKMAVEKEYAPAQYLLGYSYANGIGVAKDPSLALQLIRAAADQQFGPAVDYLRVEEGAQESESRAQAQPQPGGQNQAPRSPAERLQQAKKLLDDGLMSREEYESARKRILDDL